MKSLKPLMLTKDPVTGSTEIDPQLVIGPFESFEDFKSVYEILSEAGENMYNLLPWYSRLEWSSGPDYRSMRVHEGEWGTTAMDPTISVDEFIEKYDR